MFSTFVENPGIPIFDCFQDGIFSSDESKKISLENKIKSLQDRKDEMDQLMSALRNVNSVEGMYVMCTIIWSMVKEFLKGFLGLVWICSLFFLGTQ